MKKANPKSVSFPTAFYEYLEHNSGPLFWNPGLRNLVLKMSKCIQGKGTIQFNIFQFFKSGG
jgi:hypothetical protein